MSNLSGIEAIAARKKEIDAEIAALRKEAEELDVALRVFNRFAPTTEKEEATKLGPPRPVGIPTIFEMTYTVIREAEQRGKPGLLAKEIVDEIGKRYWPGVQGQQIMASIYNMAKQGRFDKSEDGLFSTVRMKEAPAENSTGASKPESDGTTNP